MTGTEYDLIEVNSYFPLVHYCRRWFRPNLSQDIHLNLTFGQSSRRRITATVGDWKVAGYPT